MSKEVIDNYGEINLFYRLSRALLDLTDIQQTCRNILDQALDRIPSHKAFILLLEPNQRDFLLAAGRGEGLDGKEGAVFHCGQEGCVLGKILETKKSVFSNDIQNFNFDLNHGCNKLMGKHSLLAVPMPMLTLGESPVQEFIGVIALSDKKTDGFHYSSPDFKLLLSLASQASISISHWKTLEKVRTSKQALEETYNELMRTYESLQKQASLNEQINQISKRIHATENIRSIFSALADYSKNLLRAEFCLAAYKKRGDENIEIQATSGFKERDRIKEITKNLKSGPFRNILEAGGSYSFEERQDGPVDLGLGLKETHVRSFMGIPIFSHGAPMGLIAVFNCERETGFSVEDGELLSSLTLQASTVLENAALINDLKVAQYTTMIKLAELAEKRDPETGLHLERMKHYSRILALELGKLPAYAAILTEDFAEALFQSSPLHDIGKVGIDDSILLKPGKLSPEEFEVMKTHAVIGGDILKGPDFLRIGRNLALCHHEKYNGTGYPKGLQGEEIPIEARILSVADVFDALTSRRVYKEPFTFERTYGIILEEKGKAFDPNVVDAFCGCIEKFKEIQEKYGD